MPTRIQRRRTKGWRAPAGAVYVGRGTCWGNPALVVSASPGWSIALPSGRDSRVFAFKAEARRAAVAAYREHLPARLVDAARRELAGRDLMCWCPLPEPGEPDHCHAAVLLELAAGEAS